MTTVPAPAEATSSTSSTSSSTAAVDLVDDVELPADLVEAVHSRRSSTCDASPAAEDDGSGGSGVSPGLAHPDELVQLQPVAWRAALEAYLSRRDVAASTTRSYRATLGCITGALSVDAGDAVPVCDLSAADLYAALEAAYGEAQPATWNRAAAILRGFVGWCADRDWCRESTAHRLGRLARRRRVPQDHDRALSRERVEQLCTDRRIPLRERTLWRLLYETAARAEEVLCLDVADLDQANRTARTVRKGGDADVLHYATGSARLLPRLLAGRTAGPVFLSTLPPRAEAAPALGDQDPSSGRGRLSYRQAAELFSRHSGGATLHQLRHSALTHLAEDGASTPLLLAKSRHASIRSLQRYARPSQQAVADLTAAADPHRRRR